jgi:NADH-quinone oxidoreductase subunit K
MNNILNEIGIENYIFLSVILFCIGFLVCTAEMLSSYLSIEIMLNALIYCLWLFNLSSGCTGQVLYFFYGCSRCQVAVGLAILVSIFRNLGSIDNKKT